MSGWNYTIAAGSPVYGVISFPAIVGGWGPAGYTLPASGTSPSCLLPGSTDFYRHAENYSDMSGIVKNGTTIGSCDNGDYVDYKLANHINFGSTGYTKFIARLAISAANAGQHIEVHLDSLTGTKIADLTTTSTGSYSTYQEEQVTMTGATGSHDIYIKFVGTLGVANVDYFRFKQ
jgi:hypothetical protein